MQVITDFHYLPKNQIVPLLIGLPGERLEIANDQVSINGELIDEPYAYFEPEEKTSKQAKGFTDAEPVSRFGPIVIPEGKLFVMGDNRYNSVDSRYFGLVELETVKSKVSFIYWSQNPDNDTFEGINFDRIFKKIE